MANKIIQLTLLFSLFSQITSAQSIHFFNTYGGNSYDYGQGVVQLPDSSYAITGSSSSFFEGPSQAFILRVDSAGNYKWSLNYGGNQSDIGRRIFYKPSQGYWIAGYSNSFGAGDFDFALIKTDINGTQQWEKTYGTTDLERLWDAVMLPDSGLVMVGETSGSLSLDEDIYIVRTDFNGDTIWTKRIQTSGIDIAYTCLLQNDTTLLIAGKSIDTANTTDSSTAYLVSMHINGTTNWQNFYGKNGQAEIYDIDTSSTDLYLAGGLILTDSTEMDDWLMRTTNTGTPKDSLFGHSNGKDYYSHLAIRQPNDLFLSSWTETTDFSLYPGGPDLLFYKFHTDLNWGGLSGTYSGVGPDECHQMISTSDGGIAFVGFTSDTGYCQGGAGITLIKFGGNDELPSYTDPNHQLVSITEEFVTYDLSLYPNPVENTLHVSIGDYKGNLNYQLINSQGQIIDSGELKESIPMENFPKGLYFLQIKSTSELKVVKIIKN